MTRQVTINGKTVRLKKTALLGVGGEAEVYRLRNTAVKVYHGLDTLEQLNPGLSRRKLEQGLERRREKIRVFPQGLPDNVLSPCDLVYRGGDLSGFTMPLVEGAQDIRLLADRRFREGMISNAQVTALLLALQQTLSEVHHQGIVVGDLNDSNVLFRDSEVWLIDADSMQFGPFPCPVGTERFLDPLLYGQDLSVQPLFSVASDHYAFAALLTSLLLYVGPFGGVHKQHRTWLRRAEARVSIFDPQVRYPKAAMRYDILPDEWLHYLQGVFEQDRRDPLPTQMLTDLHWEQCSCGLEYARPQCPCHKQMGLPKEAIVIHRACKATTLFKTSGRILLVRLEAGRLKYVYEEGGVVRREDQGKVMEGIIAPGMRFAIMGKSTWVGLGDQLVEVRGEAVIDRRTTGTLGEWPIFAAAPHTLLHLRDNYLVGRKRIGQVLPNQTWFDVGEDFGFGFYRTGVTAFFFLFEVDRPHLTEVELPQFRGRVTGVRCIFAQDHLLCLVAQEVSGKNINSMYLIRRRDGSLKASASEEASSSRMLSTIEGKALQGSHILCTTDEGLLLLSVDTKNGSITEAKLFSDTEPFVAAGMDVFPAPSGVYVMSEREIKLLELL